MKLINLLPAILLLLLFCQPASAQHPVIGFVYDATSKSPVAFVSVTRGNTGVLTDIDGRFSILTDSGSNTIHISHIGYKPATVTLTANTRVPLEVYIEPDGKELDNVIITPGENPAHRIIRLLQQNKKKHDPAYISSFEYNAYTVAALGSGDFFWKAGVNAGSADSTNKKKQRSVPEEKRKNDSILINRFRNNYLFLAESYTKRIYRYPKQTRETVLATKVTGIKSPSFAMTTTNFQPFGFYDDYLQLGDKAYVNPVIDGSISMYRFKLAETQVNEHDTTFIIRFQPRKGTNFTGLKGTLYINSDGYAIENVEAAAADEKGLLLRYRLQQKYERINGRWFPAQLNSTITQTDAKTDSALLYWDTRSYISNTVFEKPFTKKDFSDITTDYDPAAGKHPEEDWTRFRTDSLKQREKETYQTYTMVPKKFLNALEKGNKLIEIAALQALTYGKVDIPLKYFLNGANRYERLRIGGGFQTNEFFNRSISFGGFAGYGIRDKAWKYGGNILLTFDKRTNTTAQLVYSRDVTEPGNTDYFIRNGSVFSRQTLRNFYTNRMDSIEQVRFDVSTGITPWWQTNLWLLHENRNPARYDWRYENTNTGLTYRSFKNTEAGIGIRLARGERFSMLARAKVLSQPANTELMVQLSKGFNNLLNGALQYTKVAVQFSHSFRLKRLGKTSFQIEAGQVWGDVPYAYLFNSRAANTGAPVSIFIPFAFQTAGLYEFAADRTASFFMQHNFGNLLFKPSNPHIRPEFSIVQAISFGSLQNPQRQKGIDIKTATKGLYETGLLVDNIYRKNMQFFYLGIGAGIFYRYGPYQLPKAMDNVEWKTGIKLSF